MAKLFHPDASGVSFNGKSFEAAKDGSIVVPDEAVAALVESHGFFTSAEAAELAAERAAEGEATRNPASAKTAHDLAAAHVAAMAAAEVEHAAKVKELEAQIAELKAKKK
jgi:hypothetical protein